MDAISEIQNLLCDTLGVQKQALPIHQTEDELLNWLIDYIDELVSRDFDALLLLLYRIDVSEDRVKKLLEKAQGQNTSRIIAELIIERQKQKLYWRNKFKSQLIKQDEDDEERW